MNIKIGNYITEVNPNSLKEEIAEISFGQEQKIMIQCDSHDNWHVVNAVNGYGENNLSEFLNEKVEVNYIIPASDEMSLETRGYVNKK